MRSIVMGACIATIISGHARADRFRHTQRGADPDDLVDKWGTKVVNGCGPGATEVSDSWRLMDNHTYREGGVRYTVSFRDACNLHDAGYEGFFYIVVNGKLVREPLVYDKILDQDVDYSTMSREDVDARFFADMQAACDQQILPQPGDEALAADAIAACKNRGQGSSLGAWGAVTIWNTVRGWADTHFRTLGHRRKNDGSCIDHPEERGCRFSHYHDEDPLAPICMDRGRRFAADDEPCTDLRQAP